MRNRAFDANHFAGIGQLFQTGRAKQYLRCCSAASFRIEKSVWFQRSFIIWSILFTISNTVSGTKDEFFTYQRSTAQPVHILHARIGTTVSNSSHMRELHVMGKQAANDQRCFDYAAFGCQMWNQTGMHCWTVLVLVYILRVGFAHYRNRKKNGLL